MKWTTTVCILLLVTQSYAQDKTVKELQDEASKTIKKDETDTLQKIWKTGGLYNLSISQGSLSNWAAGGDDFSLSLNSYLSLYAFYKKGNRSWDNTLDSYLGYLKTTSLGSRKNDDRLDILSKYEYAFTKHLNLAALFNFRTQFFKGYTYTDQQNTLASSFLSPGYVLVSPGIDYKPSQFFSIFVSPFTNRWVIVQNDSLSAKGLYGVNPGKHVSSELGAFITVNLLKEFNKTVSYKGRLDLFSNYKHEPENIDVFMSNALFLKVSKILTASWNVDLIYDDDVKLFGKNKNSAALQLKSLVGLGFAVKF